MNFYDKTFSEAVFTLLPYAGEIGGQFFEDNSENKLPEYSVKTDSDLCLPPRATNDDIAVEYLTKKRCISESILKHFLFEGDIYEEATYHNIVFVGRNLFRDPLYAHKRSTTSPLKFDVKGSDKACNFAYRCYDCCDTVFAFEAPIDLLSFMDLFDRKIGENSSCISLGGVSPNALLRFLEENPDVEIVCLCLDSDDAGNEACKRIAAQLPKDLKVIRIEPALKDWNEILVNNKTNIINMIKPIKAVSVIK